MFLIINEKKIHCALPKVCEKFNLFSILQLFYFLCKGTGMFPRFSIKKRLYEANQVAEPFGFYVF